MKTKIKSEIEAADAIVKIPIDKIRPNREQNTGIRDNEKFDIIYANLAFTSPKYCRKIRKSNYYQAVCMDENSLKEFILSSPKYLKDNGKIYFTYGSSGNLEYLYFLVSLTPFNLTTEEILERPDLGETFFIFKLEKQP